VTYEARLSDRFTFDGTVGAAVGGTLTIGPQAYALDPGPLGAASFSYRAVDDRGARPFVLLSLSLAASWATTTLRGSSASDAMTATDVRLGVTAGKTIARVMTPYLAVRAFGGPVLWTHDGESATGTDAYHYQVGGGFSLALGRADVHMEVAPLGERALACGAGFAF
jgi:hypothetical protein